MAIDGAPWITAQPSGPGAGSYGCQSYHCRPFRILFWGHSLAHDLWSRWHDMTGGDCASWTVRARLLRRTS